MTDYDVRAHAQALPDEGPTQEMNRKDAFDRAYSRWLRACAALNDPDEPVTDESMDNRLREQSSAERDLFYVPARPLSTYGANCKPSSSCLTTSRRAACGQTICLGSHSARSRPTS